MYSQAAEMLKNQDYLRKIGADHIAIPSTEQEKLDREWEYFETVCDQVFFILENSKYKLKRQQDILKGRLNPPPPPPTPPKDVVMDLEEPEPANATTATSVTPIVSAATPLTTEPIVQAPAAPVLATPMAVDTPMATTSTVNLTEPNPSTTVATTAATAATAITATAEVAEAVEAAAATTTAAAAAPESTPANAQNTPMTTTAQLLSASSSSTEALPTSISSPHLPISANISPMTVAATAMTTGQFDGTSFDLPMMSPPGGLDLSSLTSGISSVSGVTTSSVFTSPLTIGANLDLSGGLNPIVSTAALLSSAANAVAPIVNISEDSLMDTGLSLDDDNVEDSMLDLGDIGNLGDSLGDLDDMINF
ncbi:hypothetical protein BGW38_004753 [Lunasporangiospora selenospora]|uniref:Uncharacterized protein n=1 Tax=Lunasporangiospora selenospora TaxID=979761 RepID=A0A9P6FQX1_9FUNG|nr:hypothetical protein BGW38_004753 [Lunasporangiospora selenospora]